MGKIFKIYIKHLLLISIIGFPLFSTLKYFKKINPIVKELSDFRFTDIYFGHFQKKELDNDIFLVDIGKKDNLKTRKEITSFINNINQNHRPKVLAIDINFKHDPLVSDSINQNLISALESNNTVIYYDLIPNSFSEEKDFLQDKSEIPIDYSIVEEGFSNCLVEKDTFGVLRFFQPYIISGEDTLKHLSIVTADKFGEKSSSVLKKNKKVMINFGYKYNNSIPVSDREKYYQLKDKIVILGLFTKNKLGQPLYNEDLHYTSSNKYYLGKSFPNMYGGEVLATIISNIKNNSFIEYKKGVSFIINLILSFLVYYLLLHFKINYKNLFGTIEILTKFVLAIFFVLVSIFIIAKTNFYIDLTAVGLISFFAVDFIGPINNIIQSIDKWHNKNYSK